MSGDSLVKAAKEALDIPRLWEMRGWPGQPGKECFRPYAPEDTRKSGSVFADGRIFKDFKSGDAYDAPELLAAVEDLDNGAACRLFIELAGVKGDDAPARRPAERTKATIPPKVEEPRREKPEVPALKVPDEVSLDIIGELRGVGPRGPALASERGLLFLASWGGADCWAVTDDNRWNVQFRKMDGKPFVSQGKSRKTLSVKGGRAAWPIGCANLGHRINVILVEGSGDFIAAHDLVAAEGVEDTTSVICLAGASVRIPPDALEFFRGRRVRMFPHLDDSEAGFDAAVRWETQLEAAGAARVECYDFAGLTLADGKPVEDLNDLALMAEDDLRALGAITRF